MNAANGDALALRPGLTDVQHRQARAVERLRAPFATLDELQRWKLDVTHAAVGRINEGLSALLGDGAVGIISDRLLMETGPAGDEWRTDFQAGLALAFGWSLRELSQISQEALAVVASGGIARARLDYDPAERTSYR